MQSANDSVKHFTMAGYSGTPLPQKLGIKTGTTIVVINEPPNYRKLLGKLDRVTFSNRIRAKSDFVHLFAKRRSELQSKLSILRGKISDNGTIWVSWPKKSANVPTDITEDVLREVALPLGLADIKVCAVDETWSGLKLMIRCENREFKSNNMRRIVSIGVGLFLSCVTAAWPQMRPVHTFSIVARDPQTGELGVAVQSHWFAVGDTVPWAEAGVGAVATQSFADASYGKLGLDLMRAGRSAPDALRGLLSADKSCEMRQVAMIDINGNVASFTGAKNISPAGGTIVGAKEAQFNCGSAGGALLEGKDFSAQANLMSNDKIWPAMAQAFQQSKGDLAERMMAALDAAQAAGGDTRGRQSAALIVVNGKSTGRPWNDTRFNLRVDDSPEPLKELRKLVLLQRAYNHMNAGDEAVEHHDNESALREYALAEETASKAANVEPSRLSEMRFWHAVALVNMKRVDESLPIFKQVFAGANGANWRELTGHLLKSGLLPDDSALIKKIQSQ